jgi:4'-phosphopantetheinyl transferase
LSTESPPAAEPSVRPFEVDVVPGLPPVLVAAEREGQRDHHADWAQLAPAEHAAVDAMGSERAAEFVRGRSLLRRLAGFLLDVPPDEVPLDLQPGGRPYLSGTTLGISLSHTAGHTAAAAWGCGEVGVDVQDPPARPDARLIRRCCGAWSEQLLSRPAEQRGFAFARVWSVQESCAKAVGLGLAALPWRIPVAPDADHGRWGQVVWRYLDTIEPVCLAVAALPRHQPYAAAQRALSAAAGQHLRPSTRSRTRPSREESR